ncbi:hypothetical protein M2459_001369 [Parabacteroides sp. PF5-5]|uniref:hypothetical protein n=1 Tax=unclassified Parabacteroides TaxID=2649774 RepID=UPI002474C304|nr:MULTISPECIES: hypothetical protein [unclassified Parabacteroides]MDH6304633.1 hypothetical protein [Parabacteroides sp. PH5-39]MDH6315753.1 hypothetical protein [Parabacteroides sp. PF5-13]MDH6319413.1 hypothetical protein [Parabacteroides sp. PH5-13]MDH6323144.1 hypothetical protein [Parabacteroides sp. PH5-8]MDH6326946.1 hypothetical protein [Parabacteroides sp. PH5-41]
MGLLIGIDPDTIKSGFASFDVETEKLEVESLTFFEVFDRLSELQGCILLVRIEAGWLNKKSNFHGKYLQSKSAGERIAKNVGANHETGRKLVEMCERLNIPYELVKPLGTKSIDAKTFRLITKVEGRINQDERDAGMLVYKFRRMKIRK